MYHVTAEYSLDRILPLIGSTNERVLLDGYKVCVSSNRLLVFKRSLKCVKCGRVGHVFRLESTKKNDPMPHLNLYHVSKNGDYILMTKDHIIPRVSGGPNHVDNLQTMCTLCNCRKGIIIDTNEFNEKVWKIFDKIMSKY